MMPKLEVTVPAVQRILKERYRFTEKFLENPQDLYVTEPIFWQLKDSFDWIRQRPILLGMNVWVVEHPKQEIRLA
jgi:hypothetical protein